jgi:immune inhibitor A
VSTRRWLLLAVVLAVLVAASLTLAVAKPAPDAGKQVSDIGMFGAGKWTEHYRVPSEAQIELILADEGISLKGADARAKAMEAFRQEWAERNPTTPNPKKLQELLENERAGEPGLKGMTDFKSLTVPMEFDPAEETFDWYGTPITAAGPLHNQIPAPGPRDNNTVWYEDATPALYDELFFGVGPTAGVIVDHPNLGTVDLRGNTMANFILEQSEGKFQPTGEVYPKWLQAAHSEAYYGADNETGSNHNIRADELVIEAVDAINADDPAFPWQQYDGNDDGVVDNFTVIHAGMGQEGGGGQQGDFAIWSHASAVGYPTGYLACAAGTHGATRDIYVREYSMDPENIDVGVISEEFGHAAFGLPDIYTTDYQNSVSNWAIMESGSWNGILGGMQPAPFPLYFRYLIGWANPVQIDYSAKTPNIQTVGQLSKRPAGTKQGLKINLPDQVVEVPNMAGTGNGWWSTKADLADFYLARDFNLMGTTAPIFSFASYWSFEEDYDYGYVEVSTDDGATWTALADMDAVLVDDGSGTMALNGEGSGTLRFDLTAYAGQYIDLRLHDISDVGVQWAGWWADDFALVDGATTLFSDDCDPEPDIDWSTNAFTMVPLSETYPLYYLAEWRNNSGFDRGLKYAYSTVYNNDATTEWEVDRSPYSVPGMLLWLRNGAYDFDYVLSDSWWDPPAYGPKHALSIVDSHYWPLTWSNIESSIGVPLRISTRCQPSNAAFTLQKTTPFTLRLGYDPTTGEYVDEPMEVKTFAAQKGVAQFHDSLGYYPGLWYDMWTGSLYFWQAEASTTVPAQGPYTSKITWKSQAPCTLLYGYDMGDTILGSGDPRDSGVQYGVNIAVLSKATNGSWGKIAVWNATTLAKVKVVADRSKAAPGQLIKYTVTVRNPGPAKQPFRVEAPIPANTTFSSGKYYDKTARSIVWKGTVAAGQTKTLVYYVKVNKGTAAGTLITNTATLYDDANGSTSSAKTTVR